MVLVFSLFVVLSWIDAITTQYALANGAVEMNPVLAPFVGTTHLFLITKMLGVAVVIALAGAARFLYREGPSMVLYAACAGAVIPVIWNLYILYSFIVP
jgi:hypothetical protein